LAGSQSEFFEQKTQMAFGWLADQSCRFSKIQSAPFLLNVTDTIRPATNPHSPGIFLRKNAMSWSPHHPGGCQDVGGFFVGVTPSNFWLHAAKNWWQTSQNECFTIIILASKPLQQQDVMHQTIFS
jgi:hypothetical protein